MANALLAAGLGFFLLKTFTDGQEQRSITDNVLTDMTISSTFTSIQDCVSNIEGEQTINISSKQSSYITDLEETTQKNVLWCGEVHKKILDARTKLVSESNTPLQVNNNNWSTLNTSQYTPCVIIQKDTTAENIVQSQTFKTQTKCQFTDINTENLQSSITGKIQSTLENQEDAIGQMEDSASGSKELISNDLGSILSQTVSESFVNQLNTNTSSSQSIDIKNKQNSMYISAVKQTFNSSTITSIKTVNQVTNDLSQSVDYSIANLLQNQNDTINDIGKDFTGIIDGISGMIEEVTGQFLVIAACVLGILMIFFGTAYLINKKFREKISQISNRTIDSVDRYVQ